jgi:hypothetical protein
LKGIKLLAECGYLLGFLAELATGRRDRPAAPPPGRMVAFGGLRSLPSTHRELRDRLRCEVHPPSAPELVSTR